jgi:radical SAM superfamily enzyme YgiQ (UPF0313 family)
MHHRVEKPVNAVLVSLYSKNYPAIGESHGLSAVAGELMASMPPERLQLRVLDMVEWGEEDCSRVLRLIDEIEANVLAIGLPYGTFSVFKGQYASLRSALHGTKPLVALGGPMATYLSTEILHEVASDAIVIVGEAELALPAVVEAWQHGHSMERIPNLHYIDHVPEQDVRTQRQLVDISKTAPPYRAHIRGIHGRGGQVYIESSRGCSWAACTFCLRGLTDVAGRGHEYRRKPAELVASDLSGLWGLGITDVTFADEDFLGGPLDSAEQFISELQRHALATWPKFDASMTVHSVYCRHDSAVDLDRRRNLLAKLARMGLQKVFLGIESCSPSQLRRYAKGHTREEAAAAMRLLQGLGIRVEIGVILFDPLCNLYEIEDSLRFMRDNNLVQLASGISSELRLQKGSHYLTMLDKHEKRLGRKIYSDELNLDTLSHPYQFVDESVQDFFSMVVKWNRCVRPLYYPAKSLSRFGEFGAIGTAVHALREATEQFRAESCDALLEALTVIRQEGDGEAVLSRLFGKATQSLAAAVRESVGALPPQQAKHPVARQALAAATNASAVERSAVSL